jgi:S1-C subfamily serine protease
VHAPHLHFPKLPDWVVYLAVVFAFLVAALSRGERADAPPAPPPPAPGEGAVLSEATPFDDSLAVKAPPPTQRSAGTAFSVSESGVWLTAAHVLEGCRQAALMVGPNRGVQAKVSLDPASDLAILRTEGGAPAAPMALGQPLKVGERGFHPGYPQGRPGEATSRVLGRQTLVAHADGAREAHAQPVVAWAEVGRTDGLSSLSGLSGAPVLDEAGRVVGVTLAEAPRRGRIYTVAPETLAAVLKRAGITPTAAPTGDPVTVENYGRVADALRRDLKVAQVVCLKR